MRLAMSFSRKLPFATLRHCARGNTRIRSRSSGSISTSHHCGIGRHLAPHVTAAAKQQCPAQCIGRFIREVGTQDEMFELLAVVVELFLIELVLQELRDDFRFSDVP